MSIYDSLLADIEIPKFVKVRQDMPDMHIDSVESGVRDALLRPGTLDRIRPGDSVCIAVGSRDVANIARITRAVCDSVKSVGAVPFIIPAMGSHGGAIAEGQRGILAGYGVTEETMGVEIRAAMDTVIIGKTPSGLDVHLDKYADAADYIIPIGRIKPHTDFRGKVESGLCKMMVIGMGKQQGAYICHKFGFSNMAENVIAIAEVIIAKKPNMFAVGLIENSFHQTYKIVTVPSEKVLAEEPGLLIEAKKMTGRIPFERVDALFVNQIGKDISGAGMDTNVVGRSAVLGISKPFFQSIAVLDLTDKSHHNFGGLGYADVTTQRLYDKIDFEQTYPNGITCALAAGMKIPAVMPNDRLAFKFCLRMTTDIDLEKGLRVVWIKDTLSLWEFYISESLIEDAKKTTSLTILSEPRSAVFDRDGNIADHFF